MPSGDSCPSRPAAGDPGPVSTIEVAAAFLQKLGMQIAASSCPHPLGLVAQQGTITVFGIVVPTALVYGQIECRSVVFRNYMLDLAQQWSATRPLPTPSWRFDLIAVQHVPCRVTGYQQDPFQ